MKYIVRAFVVVLALGGVAATCQTSSAVKGETVSTVRVSMLPIPSCAPNDPNACGMGTR